MTLYQNILMGVSLAAAFVLAAAGVVVWCEVREVLPGRRILQAFLRLPWLVRLFLVAFVVQLVVHGSTKTNQTNGVGGGTTNAPTMTGAVLGGARGRAPNGVVQPEAGRVPTGAVLAQNQWRRGCWEDWLSVSFEDRWVFPHGTNHLSHVAVMTQGELRTGVRDTDAVASLGAKVAHVPFDTCFYHELTPSNTYRFVWDRAYVDRNTNAPMYAAIELFRNGDTCVTTNGVAAFTPREIPFPHIGIGQNDDWVRTNFVNAAEILAVGYANWVDAQVGYGEDNGLYKLTATVANEPPEAFLLTVGEQSVAIAHAGEYVFLLEKGEEYSIDTWPKGMDVEFSAQDDVDPYGPLLTSWWNGWSWSEWTTDGGALHLIYPTFTGEGRIWWMPTFYGSPDIGHVGPDSGAMTFTAVLSDYRYAESVAYHWSCEDGNVVIASPNSRETTITFVTMPSWREATLTVTATVGTNELCSTLTGFTYGTNDTPQVYFCFSAPDAVLLNRNRTDNAKLRKMSLSLSSDTDRSGQVRLSCTAGSDKIAIWGTSNRTSRISLSQTWSAAAFTNLEAYVEGCATSSALEDVRLKAEYVPDDGDAQEINRDLTVVEIGEVSLPGAPDDGLVVLRGTSVLFEVDCRPEAAEPLVSTLWEVRRIKADVTYDEWCLASVRSGGCESVYVPSFAGIYQVRVKAGVGGPGVDERCYLWDDYSDYIHGDKVPGDLKAFGVCDAIWQMNVRNAVKSFLGDDSYAKAARVPAYGLYSAVRWWAWKCNIFVAHRLYDCGFSIPAVHAEKWPPLANEWGSSSFEITGWRVLGSEEYLQPGMVAIRTHEGGSGHVGILDFDGVTISAQEYKVTRKSNPENWDNAVFRTYEGD